MRALSNLAFPPRQDLIQQLERFFEKSFFVPSPFVKRPLWLKWFISPFPLHTPAHNPVVVNRLGTSPRVMRCCCCGF